MHLPLPSLSLAFLILSKIFRISWWKFVQCFSTVSSVSNIVSGSLNLFCLISFQMNDSVISFLCKKTFSFNVKWVKYLLAHVRKEEKRGFEEIADSAVSPGIDRVLKSAVYSNHWKTKHQQIFFCFNGCYIFWLYFSSLSLIQLISCSGLLKGRAKSPPTLVGTVMSICSIYEGGQA